MGFVFSTTDTVGVDGVKSEGTGEGDEESDVTAEGTAGEDVV